MKKFLMILLPAVFMAGFISCKSNEVQAEEAKTEVEITAEEAAAAAEEAPVITEEEAKKIADGYAK